MKTVDEDVGERLIRMECRADLVQALAAIDREVCHPEIYEDLSNEDA